MRLIDKINSAIDEYICFADGIDIVAKNEGSLLNAVLVLLHYKIDENLPCFRLNRDLTIEDVTNSELTDVGYVYDFLESIRKSEEKLSFLESTDITLSAEIAERYKNYYWLKESFFNFEPIKEITLVENSKTKITVSRLPEPIKPLTGVGSAIQIDKRLPDWGIWLEIPELSLWECVALSLNIAPNKVRHASMGGINEGTDFRNRLMLLERNLNKSPLLVSLNTIPHRLDRANKIDPSHFVQYALSLSQPWAMPTELMALKDRQLPESGIEKQKTREQRCELLLAENDDLKARIAELEAVSNVTLNAIDSGEVKLQDSDLILVAILMEMLVNEKNNYNQSNRLQEIEDNANGITGLSTSRTQKVLAKANKLYKAMKNKKMQ